MNTIAIQVNSDLKIGDDAISKNDNFWAGAKHLPLRFKHKIYKMIDIGNGEIGYINECDNKPNCIQHLTDFIKIKLIKVPTEDELNNE